MARDWEQTFRDWSKPSSDTEDEKQAHTQKMIRDAIYADPWLSERMERVFAKGSYANNTNVRLDSDVDICVQVRCVFFNHEPSVPFDPAAVGISVPCEYTFMEFKDHVEAALVAKFGRSAVGRANKAFDVHENTSRVSADVLPAWGYRYYYSSSECHYGTKFQTDSGVEIVNWPDQQRENGIAKNQATGGRYKFMVRVMKRLRNEMSDEGMTDADGVPSYLIESLVWNVPNEGFGHDSYTEDVRSILVHTFNQTMNDEGCSEWGEVNELKYLFRPGQPWNRVQAHAFLGAAWNYVGFD